MIPPKVALWRPQEESFIGVMAVNLEQIEAFLVEADLKYRLEEEGHLLTGFATQSYENEDGRRGVAVAVVLSDDGRVLEFTAPPALRCPPLPFP